MNINFNFKGASFNAADLFGSTAPVAAGSTPVPGAAAPAAATATAAGAGATAAALPAALPGAKPATASVRSLFADAMVATVQAGKPAARAPAGEDEAAPAPAIDASALPQQAALPAMAAAWLAAPEPAAAPGVAAAPGSVAPAATAPAVVASAPADASADPLPAPRTLSDEPAAPGMNVSVLPAAIPFNPQLGRPVAAAQLGAPLAAALPGVLPPATGDTGPAAPAVRAKTVPAAVETPSGMPLPAVAAHAASDFSQVLPAPIPGVPGMSAAAPEAARPDAAVAAAAAMTTAAPAIALAAAMPAAAVLPAAPARVAARDTVAAATDPAAPARPAAVRPLPGLDAAIGLPAKATAGAAVFALPAAAGTDNERSAAPAATVQAVTSAGPGLAAGTPGQGADTIKLGGTAQQWQEPLREALGERLQTQIGRNSEHAVIRLDPPMLGRIDISIRHTAGMLQVNLSASNTDVLRQLQGIGENMRNDLAQRQYTEVAVNISATPRSPAAQAFAEGDARGQRQPGRQHDDAEPGRALSDGTTAGAPYGSTFAMHEREYN